ncbi:hypothetical protein ACFE04_021642 [Oxalis oulophora]
MRENRNIPSLNSCGGMNEIQNQVGPRPRGKGVHVAMPLAAGGNNLKALGLDVVGQSSKKRKTGMNEAAGEVQQLGRIIQGAFTTLSSQSSGLGQPLSVQGLVRVIRAERPSLKGWIDILWDDETRINLLSFSQEHIYVEVDGRWRLTGFYANPVTHLRVGSWMKLRNLRGASTLPWIVGGDFNESLSQDEKSSPYSRWLRLPLTIPSRSLKPLRQRGGLVAVTYPNKLLIPSSLIPINPKSVDSLNPSSQSMKPSGKEGELGVWTEWGPPERMMSLGLCFWIFERGEVPEMQREKMESDRI